MINEARQPRPLLSARESAAGCCGPFPSPQNGKLLSRGQPGLTRVWLRASLCCASSLMPYIFHR